MDLSQFDTSNVENMSGMFHGCSKLENVDVSTSVDFMFSGCSGLERITVPKSTGVEVQLPTEKGIWSDENGNAYNTLKFRRMPQKVLY